MNKHSNSLLNSAKNHHRSQASVLPCMPSANAAADRFFSIFVCRLHTLSPHETYFKFSASTPLLFEKSAPATLRCVVKTSLWRRSLQMASSSSCLMRSFVMP